MYKIKADGQVLYDPSSDDMAYHVLAPRAKYELNKTGSLTFTMLPGNVMYDSLKKLKTVITLEQDGEVIFRGRVLETTVDLYNQKEVYCEGELGYLLDSMVLPFENSGSAVGFLQFILHNHNNQVDESKRFTLGMTTALKDGFKVITDSYDYRNTLDEIRDKLVEEFNGYLRVRLEDGVRYLDYVDVFDQPCSQEINFGVNLLDIENTVNAKDFCTVLIPLGKMEKEEYLTIEEVNSGSIYLEDAEAIAEYGRIVKAHIFSDEEDPAALKELGKSYLDGMKLQTTLVITAVDLKTCGADVDAIHLGDTVRLVSSPHGLDREEVCTEIELDIENPENSKYTFGLPQETLTDANARDTKKKETEEEKLHIWMRETSNSFEVLVDTFDQSIIDLTAQVGENTASLELLAGPDGSMATLEADIANIESEITNILSDVVNVQTNVAYLQSDIFNVQSDIVNIQTELLQLDGFLTVNDGAEILNLLETEDLICSSLSSSDVWTGEVNADSINTEQLTVYGDADLAGLSVQGATYSGAQIEVMTGFPYFDIETIVTGDGRIVDVVTHVGEPQYTTINYLGS